MSELLHARLEVADVLDEEVFRELPVHLNAAVEQQALFQFEISCWSVSWTRAQRILCFVSLLLLAFVFVFFIQSRVSEIRFVKRLVLCNPGSSPRSCLFYC